MNTNETGLKLFPYMLARYVYEHGRNCEMAINSVVKSLRREFGLRSTFTDRERDLAVLRLIFEEKTGRKCSELEEHEIRKVVVSIARACSGMSVGKYCISLLKKANMNYYIHAEVRRDGGYSLSKLIDSLLSEVTIEHANKAIKALSDNPGES